MDFQALQNARFALTSTSAVLVLVNGEPLLVDERGHSVQVDSCGTIEIINITEGLQTPHYVLKDVPGSTLLKEPLVIDPADRIKKRMRERSKPQDLEDLTIGKDGRKLFSKTTDFNKLSQVLQGVFQEMDSLPADGTRTPSLPSLPDSNGAQSWGMLRTLQSTIDSLQDFAVTSGHLVITIAGKVTGFAIDCYEAGLQAASAIFATAGASILDLQRWLGFTWDWDDIARTQRSLSTAFNFAASLPDTVLDRAFLALDSSLSRIGANLPKANNLHDDLKEAACTRESVNRKSQRDIIADENSTPKTSHPAIDYIFRKLSHVMEGSKVHISLDINSELIRAMQNQFECVRKIYTDLANVLHDTRESQQMNLAKLLQILEEAALVTVVNEIRSALEMLKKLVKGLLKVLSDVVNRVAKTPLLSPLYKFATGSRSEPTLLDLITLVIAIPTTITCDISKGVSFPEFSQDSLAKVIPPSPGLDDGGSDDSKEMPAKRADTRSSYAQAMKELEPWIQVQAETTSAIDQTLTTLESLALLSLSPGFGGFTRDPSGELEVEEFTILISITKIFSVLATIPMIQQDNWNTTTRPALRYDAWAIDAVFTALGIITSWKASRSAEARELDRLLTVVGRSVTLAMWAFIASDELSTQFAEMSEKDYSQARTIALWSMPEYLIRYVSHVLPALVPGPTTEDVRGSIALTMCGLGLIGNTSRNLRSAYQRTGTFSVGPS